MKIKQIIFVITCFSIGFSAACWSADSNVKIRTNSSPTPLPSTSASATSTPNDNKTANNSGGSNTKLSNTTVTVTKPGGFQGNLPVGFQMPTDDVGQTLLKAYGAMFVAKGVTPPNKIVFRDESDVSVFHSSLQKSSENIGGFTIELQTPAMNALKEAVAEAKQKSETITPANADAAKRTFDATITNWTSRVDPGLVYWVKQGKLSQAEATRIKSLSAVEQIPDILKLEDQGIFFAKGNQKTIIYSVAPPGTSQHISMLALDIAEHNKSAVREILAHHGWFQTVTTDLPHFTYLGVDESELANLGLKKVTIEGREYWIPNL